jgi:hypothetical protein
MGSEFRMFLWNSNWTVPRRKGISWNIMEYPTGTNGFENHIMEAAL